MPPLRNRSTRTATEPDPFEGLPVRQWRQVEAKVGPPPEIQPVVTQNRWPELPMPRDSHLLPEHSMHLLRLARSNAGWKRKSDAMLEDEDKENGVDGEEDGGGGANGDNGNNGNNNGGSGGSNKESTRGFMAKKWSQVPRNLEEPEVEYLAKRRKGLPPLVSQSGMSGAPGPVPPAGPMRKTKVRRLDADGVAHVYEVLAPEGQKLEGEIVEEEEAQAVVVEPAAAPGTVVEGVGVVNAEGIVVAHDLLQPTPTRRKPPPPRKKKKSGPGRGHKKVVFKETDDAANANGAAGGGLLSVPGTSVDGQSSVPASTQGDTPMPDAQDGEEEEGSSGEDEEDDGREDGELSPSPEPELPPAPVIPPAVPDATTESAQDDVEVVDGPVITEDAPPTVAQALENQNGPVETQETSAEVKADTVLPELEGAPTPKDVEQSGQLPTEPEPAVQEVEVKEPEVTEAPSAPEIPEPPISVASPAIETAESLPTLPGLGAITPPDESAATIERDTTPTDAAPLAEPSALSSAVPPVDAQPPDTDVDMAEADAAPQPSTQPDEGDADPEPERSEVRPTTEPTQSASEGPISGVGGDEVDLFSSLERQLENSTPSAPATAVNLPPASPKAEEETKDEPAAEAPEQPRSGEGLGSA